MPEVRVEPGERSFCASLSFKKAATSSASDRACSTESDSNTVVFSPPRPSSDTVFTTAGGLVPYTFTWRLSLTAWKGRKSCCLDHIGPNRPHQNFTVWAV